MNHNQLYPCLFVGDKASCICYVNDFILYSWNGSDIDDIENLFIGSGEYLEEECDAAGLLGVGMKCDGETRMIELNQTGLT